MKPIYNFFHQHYHRRYHGKYAHAKKLFVLDLFLLFGALVILGAGLFFFFWKPGIQEWIDLKISFGEKRLRSGEAVTIALNYANRSKFKINNISLALHLPPGFIIDRNKTPTTEFSDNSILNLKELPPGAKGQKTIYGELWVEPKTETDIIALMSYRPENSKTREQKSGRFILNLPESVLQGELKLDASSALAGNSVPFSYNIKNTGAEPVAMNNLVRWNGGVMVWRDGDLTLGPETEIAVTGTLKMPNTAGKYPVQIETLALINGEKITQINNAAEIEIFEPRVTVGASVPSTLNFVEPGETLPVEIYWKNNSAYNLIEPRLRLRATAGTIDLKTTARENNLTLDGDELLIGPNARTALSSGAQGAFDRFTINLKLLPRFQLNTLNGQEKTYLEITPIITANLAETPGQDFTATGVSAKVLLATEMSLLAQTRYYTDEGDQLGRGPLPPQVGEITKYWVFIQARNTTNPVKDANFSAVLSPGIEFTGKQSVTIGAPLKFNLAARELTWDNSTLPANSQTGLYFEVAVNPTPEQINREIKILKNIKFSAQDSFTEKQFNLTAPDISNRLPASDPGAIKI